MKLKKFILIIFIFNSLKVFSQKNDVSNYVNIDKKVMLIPDSLTKTTNQIANYISSNFLNENEKIRAIFYWVASTIQYDIDNMFALNFYEKKKRKFQNHFLQKKEFVKIMLHYLQTSVLRVELNLILLRVILNKTGLQIISLMLGMQL